VTSGAAVQPAPFASPLAEELGPDVLERFVRYVQVDTQSDPLSDTVPSSAKQLDLSRLLVQELQELGLADAVLSVHGHVLATLPGSDGAPTVGLMAHVDTSPDASGAGVRPQVHRRYDGSALALPGDPGQVLDPAEQPALAERLGHDLVTSDGTTLLGADDKAGIAEIMAAVAWLGRHPEVPHAPVRVAFTVDEEVGRGTDHLELDEFGADVAYTLDGSDCGVIEIESFSAMEIEIRIRGRSTHPGTAKGKLVNSVKLAADLVAALPRDGLSPETTEGREGFVHPIRIRGITEETTLTFIARDHDDGRLDEHVALLRRLADELVQREPRADVTVSVTEQYRNMRPAIDAQPRVVEAALEACRRAGVEPRFELIRGGTDGSRLSERGLPTPNIFTGGQEYHSLREWASVQDMAAAAATVVELVRLWAEPEAATAAS
jgi:tripeptide aminopeptidase